MSNKVKIIVLKSSSNSKILSISGNPGDSLSEHKVDNHALLLMRTGNIIYKEEKRSQVLSAGEICDIPANIVHQITCSTNAAFFVVMPNSAKMKFEK